MFRSVNPFDKYRLYEIESHGNVHYLRRHSGVLWIVTNDGDGNFTGVRKVLGPATIHEAPMLNEEIQTFKILLEESQTLDSKIDKFNKIRGPLKGAKAVDFKISDAALVQMQEYAITNASASFPVLGTYGAGPCVILGLYDSKNKIAGLAHVSPVTTVESLQQMLNYFSKEDTVAHLAGGDNLSKEQCLNMIELLEINHIKIVNADIIKKWSIAENSSLAIDSRTGDIYAPVKYSQLSVDVDADSRLKNITPGLNPIRQIYNGLVKSSSFKIKPQLFQPEPILYTGPIYCGKNKEDLYPDLKPGFLIGKRF